LQVSKYAIYTPELEEPKRRDDSNVCPESESSLYLPNEFDAHESSFSSLKNLVFSIDVLDAYDSSINFSFLLIPLLSCTHTLDPEV
jgi:hypothetical protein